MPVYTVKVELPPAVTDAGLSDAVAPLGAPVTARLTVPALPESIAVEIVLVPDVLGLRRKLVGTALIEKSLTTAAVIVTVTVVECTLVPSVPVIVSR